MPNQTQDMNLLKLIDRFPTDDSCREVLEALRWPAGLACLRCGSTHIRHNYTRDIYDCGSCGYQFSVISGTIFHDTHLPLKKWIVAVYLMVESKKGISANQMKRMVDVSYKTAWYLCHRIRAAMNESSPKLLSGTVEADETWVGGKEHWGKKGTRRNKTIVAGVVERGGDVRMKVIEQVDRKTLHGFIQTHIDPTTGRVITDSWPAYLGIGDKDTKHEFVNHTLKEYVRGDVHTNTIENVWSLLKRSVVGSYHKVSEKHLDSYLDELEWRFNNRKNPYLFRDTLLKLLMAANLPYQELTAD